MKETSWSNVKPKLARQQWMGNPVEKVAGSADENAHISTSLLIDVPPEFELLIAATGIFRLVFRRLDFRRIVFRHRGI